MFHVKHCEGVRNMYRPLYEDTGSIQEKYPLTEEQRKQMKKCYLNSMYGTMIYKENDMRIKDFIVLHADGQPVMVKKEAITVISKMTDGTTRVETCNQIWITDDKYEDVIKRLFEV